MDFGRTYNTIQCTSARGEKNELITHTNTTHLLLIQNATPHPIVHILFGEEEMKRKEKIRQKRARKRRRTES